MSERTYLEEIAIRNLGAIEQSELELGRGLNVLTGETGAGKTMILTALSLVLGGKSDSSLVRHGSDRAIATAQFSVGNSLNSALEEIGAEIDDGSLIISRFVTTEGKSKAVMGGASVPASTLGTIAENLIEIHGQSANTQIVKTTRQRELLDRFAGAKFQEALSVYQSKYRDLNELKDRINSMRASSSKRDSEVAELEEFLKAWSSLKAVRGEVSATVDEINRLSSVEDLRIASTQALEAISIEENGALDLLGAARRAIDSVKSRDSQMAKIAESVAESLYILDEATRDLQSYSSALEADPARLDHLNSRRAELTSFIKRWGSGGDPDEVLVSLAAKAKSGRESIADLKGGDGRIAELENGLATLKSEVIKAAQLLTNVRTEAAREISKAVSDEIHGLAMPHTQFFVDVDSPDYSSSLKESDFTFLGCDEVSMSIQSHEGGTKVALGKGASGGEMSRIMLALEVVIAQHYPVGTYIFDEVDAGVGGKAAIEVGKRLHQLAQHSQVIVVTHLPQVAAWADTHFVVKKESDGTVVASGVTKISDSQRVEEIARMLAGLEESASAKEHAAELLALRGSSSS